jgi:hypothetical protein
MNGLLLPCYVENIATRKDNTIKLILSTQELTPSQAGELFSLLNNLVVTYISPKEITNKEVEQVDKLDAELGGKTQSQRIRNVLYKLFEQDAEGYKNFDQYYHAKTDQYIEHLKTKIQ